MLVYSVTTIFGFVFLQRLEMRAKKFGVELSSVAKKTARSERFGLTNNTNTATGDVKVYIHNIYFLHASTF